MTLAPGPPSALDEALAAFSAGAPVLLVDASRGDAAVVLAAATATPEAVAFAVRHTSGVLCVAMEPGRLDDLDLPPMARGGGDPGTRAFTISVDYRHGTTTGIAAEERALTMRALCDLRAEAADFARPGHVFPLRTHPRGLFGRAGPAEAAVDLARLAGAHPAAVLADLVDERGEVASEGEAARFAARHRLPVVSFGALRSRRARLEPVVTVLSTTRVASTGGELVAHTFGSVFDAGEHLALVHGDPAAAPEVLVRVQHECVLADVFAAAGCGCGEKLQAAVAAAVGADAGVVVYLRGKPSVADGTLVAAGVLRHLGARRIRLLVDEPGESVVLTGQEGLAVTGEAPLRPAFALAASS